jgi:hypothetical protein
MESPGQKMMSAIMIAIGNDKSDYNGGFRRREKKMM